MVCLSEYTERKGKLYFVRFLQTLIPTLLNHWYLSGITAYVNTVLLQIQTKHVCMNACMCMQWRNVVKVYFFQLQIPCYLLEYSNCVQLNVSLLHLSGNYCIL